MPVCSMEGNTSCGYNRAVEDMRRREYPMLGGSIYLDHAGTALYPKSLIERFSADLISNLYGNPHSASHPSQLSARRIDDARLRLLQMFHADPEDFDVVFVANTTAGVKLVAEAFREQPGGFSYAYHKDCHTSLVGVREVAREHICLASDDDANEWLQHEQHLKITASSPVLFAYPAQSNMNGRRLPLDWCKMVRFPTRGDSRAAFTLLDAAALLSTSPLDLSNPETAPDFTVLSLYKIFGFPDLGALVIRKAAGHIFGKRRYFGGGTVDMVVCLKEQWHAKKTESLHDQLEDGTLPIHNILALHSAMDVQRELFGSLEQISRHTAFLAKRLYEGLSALRHANGSLVCELYTNRSSDYGDPSKQGPIVAFNIRNSLGVWTSNFEVEKLASVKNIHLRTGGLCNPGGIASSLSLSPWEMKQNFSAGQRCGNENDIMGGKPTGMIRVSLGASSTVDDVDAFVGFVQEFFLETSVAPMPRSPVVDEVSLRTSPFFVESLTVYPIKSCAGWKVPSGVAWEVREEGLVWDREWCLVHQGTGAALSQKRYPKMALLRPTIDLEQGCLRVRYAGSSDEISVPLSADPSYFPEAGQVKQPTTRVCGDVVSAQRYSSARINGFFSQVLGVGCQLARFPAAGASARHSKAHLQQRQMPGAFPEVERPILLSNESPILIVSRSSLNRLNEQIKAHGGKAAAAEVFRANIVLAERAPGREQAYAEDGWHGVQIGQQQLELLGACRRCQMVCIDQQTARRDEEPFVTLAKTRRIAGKVFFGQHACLASRLAQHPTIAVGDGVIGR
ncbi:uncharacterized protein K452DRAFT_351214 [Aplosporella prunicola CBS 121167]|uniref:Molybdenum cofactor sulfurase n=1 Tax=Aplosporella prunicola CBS 121167 TaxID=1176127 RepID=A0A6A6BBR9_9PEZI|nr:uncharacterized protein K452DRAFT_351214 [Aplosporella prunicola CBS 121167]KAF2141682.1 hypothetical protein K452DRAFT_351214 [Aplosporella prunicola CBS 121167]